MIDKAFGHWFAGFVDGEGCFWIHKEKGGTYYACHFKIKVRDDDHAVIELIARTLGFGKVFRTKARPTPGRNGKASSVYLLQSKADCLALLPILDKFPLRAKKARDYAIWREAVVYWQTAKRGNRWHGPRDNSRMIAFKEAIEAVRAYR